MKHCKKQNIWVSQSFPIYKDSEICMDPEGLSILEDNLIDANMDDDVDTDEEILITARGNCISDLKQAE